jgi:hypothetical protein
MGEERSVMVDSHKRKSDGVGSSLEKTMVDAEPVALERNSLLTQIPSQ